MAWPTFTVTVPEYDNWEAKIYELSVEEITTFEAATSESNLFTMAESLLPSIVSWNFTDREGNEIPVTTEGLRKIPLRALKALITRMLAGLNEDFPKALTTT